MQSSPAAKPQGSRKEKRAIGEAYSILVTS